jgi:hypothetical protein
LKKSPCERIALHPFRVQVERQIEQMVRFIKQEAEEKANEIKVSAEEVRPVLWGEGWRHGSGGVQRHAGANGLHAACCINPMVYSVHARTQVSKAEHMCTSALLVLPAPQPSALSRNTRRPPNPRRNCPLPDLFRSST